MFERATTTTKVLRFQLDGRESEASSRPECDEEDAEKEDDDDLQTFGSDFALQKTMGALLYKEGPPTDRRNKTNPGRGGGKAKKKTKTKRKRNAPMVPIMGQDLEREEGDNGGGDPKYFDVMPGGGTVLEKDASGHAVRKSRRLRNKKAK